MRHQLLWGVFLFKKINCNQADNVTFNNSETRRQDTLRREQIKESF